MDRLGRREPDFLLHVGRFDLDPARPAASSAGFDVRRLGESWIFEVRGLDHTVILGPGATAGEAIAALLGAVELAGDARRAVAAAEAIVAD